MKQTIRIISFSLMLVFAACTSDSTQTAAGIVVGQATAHPDLIATTQADQYQRDAQATLDAQAMTRESLARSIQQTAESATSTVHAAYQQATATTQAQQTANALTFALTAESATVQTQVTRAAATVQAQQTSQVQTRQAMQATGTAVAAMALAAHEATRQALALEQAQSTAQRERVVTAVTTTLLITAAILGITLTAVFLWRVIPTLINRMGLIRYGQHGNPLLLTQHDGRTTISDPLRMLQAAMQIDTDGRPVMPEMTPNQLQSILNLNYWQTLVEQVRHAPGHTPQLPSETTTYRRVGSMESEKTVKYQDRPRPIHQPRLPQSESDMTRPPTSPDHLPTTVSWSQLSQWPGDGFAIGLNNQQQVITVDFGRNPHLFGAGTSGAGKSRRLLRVVVAQALTAGYRVVLMNEGGSDFAPFYDHPHAFIMHGEAAHYQAVLQAARVEVQRRESILRQHQVSEWRRLPHTDAPPILLVIDELLDLMLTIPNKAQKIFWGTLAAFASRARKVGMHSMGFATDPTRRSLGAGGLNYRQQCGRVAFRMLQSSGSRAIFDEGGAETLGDGEFMALLAGQPGIVLGKAANPSDAELKQYVSQVPLEPLPELAWLETAVHEVETLALPNRDPLFIAPTPDTAVQAEGDGRRLLAEPETYFKTRRGVATFLTDGLDNKYAYDRADAALMWLHAQGHAWAGMLLGHYPKGEDHARL